MYGAALAHELTERDITFERQKRLPVHYKGRLVGGIRRRLCSGAGKIILEVKEVSALSKAHEAQAHNYLAATGLRLAILLNFGTASLQQRRIVKWNTSHALHELHELKRQKK